MPRRSVAARRAAPFDHLIGATEQRQRNGKAERLGGLEVDDQLDFRRLHNRQVSRLFALENSAGVGADQMVGFSFVATVAQQAASLDEWAILVDRGQRVADCQRGDLFDMGVEEYVGADDQRAGF
jgi:hypothetical protein